MLELSRHWLLRLRWFCWGRSTTNLAMEKNNTKLVFRIIKFKYFEKATKFCEISTIWLYYIRSNLRRRFDKILWTSQNIWTLPTHLLCNSDIFLPTYAVKSIKQSHLFTCFGISFRKMRLHLIAVLFQASHLMANHPGNVFYSWSSA